MADSHDGTAHIGDPLYGDFVIGEYHEINRCPACSTEIDGIGVVVRGGVIREVRMFDYPDGLPVRSVSEFSTEGELRACPELDYTVHSMDSSVDGGNVNRLAAHPDLFGQQSACPISPRLPVRSERPRPTIRRKPE